MRRSHVMLTAWLVSLGWMLAAAAAPARATGSDPADGRDPSWTLASPSGAVSMTVELAGGSLEYSVSRGLNFVLQDSDLGLVRRDTSFQSGLSFVSASEAILIDEDYALLHGKTSQLRNHAHEQTLEFRNAAGKRIQLTFRAYDEGVAFRYRFPETSMMIHTVTNELTTFTIAANGRAILQPYRPESLHDIVPTQNPPSGVGGWALPALFDLGHSWVMIAESDVDESYCAAQIDKAAGYREYCIQIPEENYGEREPSSTLPWEMPWRAILVGSDAGSIIESSLVTHLADSCRISDTSWVRPGRVSWHWWSGDWVGSMTVLERYIDFAQSMGWEYSLIDADWDDYHSDEEMQGLVDYAAERGVGIFLWYNSAGPQNDHTFSPRDRMWDPGIRRAEMAKVASWGVKGLKVDFFDTDKQVMMTRYLGILQDAADQRLLVSFHGSSTPRGWRRTWPNFMTTEAVRGAEYYKFEPTFPADAPLHNVEVAFTRNVVGPMDYTPVTFSDNFYPHITTNAHELALSVVFESGLLHPADEPASYRAQPEEVQAFLMDIPVAWDEIRFVEGDPSSHVVLARRKGAEWCLGGINGTGSPRTVSIDLTGFSYPGSGGIRISDGDTPRTFASGPIQGTLLDVTMSARGGFVARFPTVPIDVPNPPIAGAAAGLLVGIRPNPFTASTQVTYWLPCGARVLLTVHDAAGRRVCTLVNAGRPAGVHSVSWDGADDAGGPLPAGVYFCRLRAGEHEMSRTVQRLR